MASRAALATLLCLSVLAACSGTAAGDLAGATCDQFSATPSIEQSRTIEAGTDLQVVLCSNPTTGFAWGEPEVGDTSVLRLVDRSFRAPDEASPPILGTAGTEILTVHAVASGATTLSLSYGRSWEVGTPAEWTYTLTVIVS